MKWLKLKKKEEKMKNKMKYLFLAVIVFLITGCQEPEVMELHRYNINEINYGEKEYKAYSVSYNTTDGNTTTKVTSRFEFMKNGSCYYYGNYSNGYGSTSIQVDSNCRYTIKDDKISITIDSLKHIYNPSSTGLSLGYRAETSYEKDYAVEAEFTEKGKFMMMGELKYRHVAYLHYVGEDVETILIDPVTKIEYKDNGIPVNTTDPDYIRENSIDVSKYTIIDK